MKQITRYILALAAVLLFTSEVMANNTATVIKKIDGAAAGTTDPGTVAYSNGTITVTPTYGYYLTAADLTVVKTIGTSSPRMASTRASIRLPTKISPLT